jgi:hypothetical protein
MNSRQDFWSRRKQAVDTEAKNDLEKQLAAEEDKATEAIEVQTDEKILEELGLQDPDTLQAGDDFSAFMAKAVPTRLRNRALRKLWLSNPALANLDALLDYGEDFTTNADAVEVIQTSYQVGKGLLAHVQEMERQEEVKLQAQNVEEAPQVEEDIEEQASIETLTFTEEDIDADIDAADDCLVVTRDEYFEVDADVVFASKKRMRFVIGAEI